jgi:N6-adenosine-specific RNA methylase IME4
MTPFTAVLADPPWPEHGAGKVKRGADRHYDLLSIPKVAEVIIGCPFWLQVAPDAHCYLWVTNNHLKGGLWVLEKIGFRYVTMLTWAKDRFGLGQYFRGQTEQVLFGVRGRLPAQSRTESTLIECQRGQHSRKPWQLYEKIERVSPGPYLELFARPAPMFGERKDWTYWGDGILSEPEG